MITSDDWEETHFPFQVHLTYWSSTSVLVSWATCDAVVGNAAAAAAAARNTAGAKSIVKYGTSNSQLHDTATSVPASYVYDYQAVEMPSYVSPLLHHVMLTGELQTAGHDAGDSRTICSVLRGLFNKLFWDEASMTYDVQLRTHQQLCQYTCICQ